MTSMRDDLQARASDTLMQALGVDRRNSDILVSDKYQSRNPNPVDLASYSFAGDDGFRSYGVATRGATQRALGR
jgi:hypothetical protein